jgi:hypothetical protein
MTTLQEIKAAIDTLPPTEQAELQRWLNERSFDAWDRQIAEDAAAGRLDDLLTQADAEIDAGGVRDFP